MEDRGLFAPETRHEDAIAKALRGVSFDIRISEGDPVKATVSTRTSPPFTMTWDFPTNASREQVVEGWDRLTERFARGVDLAAESREQQAGGAPRDDDAIEKQAADLQQHAADQRAAAEKRDELVMTSAADADRAKMQADQSKRAEAGTPRKSGR